MLELPDKSRSFSLFYIAMTFVQQKAFQRNMCIIPNEYLPGTGDVLPKGIILSQSMLPMSNF